MESATFFNSKNGDRKYNAKHWADYFKPLFTNGVFNGDLQVVANGGMSVTLKEGYAWMNGYGYHNTEPLVIDLEAASGNLNRYDTIKIKLDHTARTIKAYADKGGNATTPTKQTNTRNDTVFEITVAEVYIAAGTTVITQSMITDTRMDTSKCGWVTGTVEEIDFSQIYEQFQTYFKEQEERIATDVKNFEAAVATKKTHVNEQTQEFDTFLDDLKTTVNSDIEIMKNDYTQKISEFESTQEGEWNSWFDEKKGQLSEDPAGNLQLQIDDITAQDAKEYKTYYTLSAIGLTDGGEYSCLDIAKAMPDYSRLCLSIYASTPITDLAVSGQLGMLIIERHTVGRIFTTQYSTVQVKNPPKIHTRYIRASDNISGEWIEYITSANIVDELMAKNMSMFSDDLGDWKTGSGITQQQMQWAYIAYAADKFVGASNYGFILISEDGKSWTVTSNGIYDARGIAYGNGKYVIVGNNMTTVGLLYSTDGITWEKGTGITDVTYLYAVAYGNGKFVAGGTDGKAYYSTDGINWTVGGTTGSYTMDSVVYANDKFVAVCSGKSYYSTDGITWTAGGYTGNYSMNCVTYGNGKYVAVGDSGRTYYSTNGINWLAGAGIGSSNMNSVAYGNDRFVAVGKSGILYYSTDGINWYAGNSGVTSSLYAVAYTNGKFAVVGHQTCIYADFIVVEKNIKEAINQLYVNKLPYATAKLYTGSWKSSTEYTAYPYAYEVAISGYYDNYPEWFLKTLESDRLTPTNNEQTAFDLIDAMKLDMEEMKLKFYATERPLTDVLIIVKGVIG